MKPESRNVLYKATTPRLIFLPVTWIFCVAVHADILIEPYGDSNKYTVTVKGKITDTDVADFQKSIEKIQKNPQQLHLNMVRFDSNGGGKSSGMEIGRMIRKNRLNTYVGPKSLCNSACVYAFIGGLQRYGYGRIGVHSTTFVDDFKVDEKYVPDIVDKDIENVTGYVKEMRLSANLASAILGTPFWSIRYLSDGEKFNWNVNGTDRAESEILVTNIAKERNINRGQFTKTVERYYFYCYEQAMYLNETLWSCLKTKENSDDWITAMKKKMLGWTFIF